MPQFFIVSESNEDTLAAAEDLQAAIRTARQAAGQGEAGELVSVLESGGQAVRQFVRLPDGTVAEQPIAMPIKAVAAVTTPNLTAPTVSASGNHPVG